MKPEALTAMSLEEAKQHEAELGKKLAETSKMEKALQFFEKDP